MKFTIYGRLPSLNEYTLACRGNKFSANNMKIKAEKLILSHARATKLQRIDKYPIKLKISWYEPNKRRDIDNVVFSTKFIQDALVKGGYIENDSQKYITKLEHEVYVDNKNPRIEVEIIET